MPQRRKMIMIVTAAASAVLAGAWLAGPAHAVGQGAAAQDGACSAGAHTLSPPGAHVYPDTGNGGYTTSC
jgi:ABC-type sugar transport system substrate-binding protein